MDGYRAGHLFLQLLLLLTGLQALQLPTATVIGATAATAAIVTAAIVTAASLHLVTLMD